MPCCILEAATVSSSITIPAIAVKGCEAPSRRPTCRYHYALKPMLICRAFRKYWRVRQAAKRSYCDGTAAATPAGRYFRFRFPDIGGCLILGNKPVQLIVPPLTCNILSPDLYAVVPLLAGSNGRCRQAAPPLGRLADKRAHCMYKLAHCRTIANFKVDEGKEIIKTQPQYLSLNEMYLVANSYPKGGDDFIKVFDIAVRMYPDDEVANLNAAAVALSKKDLPDAPEVSG